jgi:hypothetical protein
MTFRTLGIAVATVLLLNGCAGYRLGPSNGMAAGERSVRVTPFVNSTMEPRLSDAVTQQMRKQLQREGTFRLATRDDADILLSGVLTRYERFEISFAPNDVLTGLDYRLILVAQITARERATGKTILDKEVRGRTLIRVGTDLTSAERQALPLLAEDLAKNITELLADGTW